MKSAKVSKTKPTDLSKNKPLLTQRVGQFRQDPVPAVFTLAHVPKVDIHRGLGVYQQFIGGR
jgi:hypothetical protein